MINNLKNFDNVLASSEALNKRYYFLIGVREAPISIKAEILTDKKEENIFLKINEKDKEKTQKFLDYANKKFDLIPIAETKNIFLIKGGNI